MRTILAATAVAVTSACFGARLDIQPGCWNWMNADCCRIGDHHFSKSCEGQGFQWTCGMIAIGSADDRMAGTWARSFSGYSNAITEPTGVKTCRFYAPTECGYYPGTCLYATEESSFNCADSPEPIGPPDCPLP